MYSVSFVSYSLWSNKGIGSLDYAFPIKANSRIQASMPYTPIYMLAPKYNIALMKINLYHQSEIIYKNFNQECGHDISYSISIIACIKHLYCDSPDTSRICNKILNGSLYYSCENVEIIEIYHVQLRKCITTTDQLLQNSENICENVRSS